MPYRSNPQARIYECISKVEGNLLEMKRNPSKHPTLKDILNKHNLDVSDPDTLAGVDTALEQRLRALIPVEKAMGVHYDDPQLQLIWWTYRQKCLSARDKIADLFVKGHIIPVDAEFHFFEDYFSSRAPRTGINAKEEAWTIYINGFLCMKISYAKKRFWRKEAITIKAEYYDIYPNDAFENGCKETFDNYKQKLLTTEGFNSFNERMSVLEDVPAFIEELPEKIRQKENEEKEKYESNIQQFFRNNQLPGTPQPLQLQARETSGNGEE